MTNQAAITMLKILEQRLDDYCGLNAEGKAAFCMAITALEQLGQNCSEFTNGWIPCSKKLPSDSEDEYVLISKKPTKISGSKWSVAIAIRTADPRSRKIQWRDSGFGIIQDDKVLAWMPLPEPWKEE